MMHNSTDESEWEVRPGGMLVQRRDDAAASDQPLQYLCVCRLWSDHQDYRFSWLIAARSSCFSARHFRYKRSCFSGNVKKAFFQKTGLEASELKILFRGVEKDVAEKLQNAGCKDASKLVLVEDLNKRVEQVEQPPVVTEEMAKAIAAVIAVTGEVDKLSDRVVALEVAVNGGTKVAVEEFDMTAELLMRQLLKLDDTEAEGEARIQRKAEVRRVQNLQEIVDKLKARCSNPFVGQSKAAAVITEWESFGNGVGRSLNPPPPASHSANVTQDWEKVD